MDDEKLVEIDYTNYRGERGTRLILPHCIVFGSNKWHPEPQWMLNAWDMEKGGVRFFAMKDVHSWKPVEQQKGKADEPMVG